MKSRGARVTSIVMALVLLTCARGSRNEPVVGIWQGALRYPGVEVRVFFKISEMADGTLTAAMMRPDEADGEIPVSRVFFGNNQLRLEVPAFNAYFQGIVSPDGSVIGGYWNQEQRPQPLSLRRVLEIAGPRRPQEPLRPYPYDEEEVAYAGLEAGVEVSGTLTLPPEGHPCPAVLLISGGGPQNRDGLILGHRPFLVLADYLTRRGIAVLRVDDRGVGASTGDRSLATPEDSARDALSGVGFLKDRREIDARRIGLIGHSEGGIVAPMAAVRSPDVAFVVIMASPGLPGDEYNHQFEESVGRALGESPETLAAKRVVREKVFAVLKQEEDRSVAEAKLRRILEEIEPPMPEASVAATVRRYLSPWFRFSVTYDPGPTLAGVECPVLAIYGSKDVQVPPDGNAEVVESALKRGGNRDYRIEILPGLNHLFQTAETGAPYEYAKIEETLSPVLLELVADWILEHAFRFRKTE